MNYFKYIDGYLHAENLNISALAAQYQTPFYCYSASAFRYQYRSFVDAFKQVPILVCYAMKANSNQAILKLLAKEGAGADVVSEGELRRALAAGISPQKIVFSGVAKSKQEIDFALHSGIRCFNVESEPELLRISDIAEQAGLVAPISLRINPDVDARTHKKISTGKSENKFGIPIMHALAAYNHAASLPGVKVVGIDMHIGSQITELGAFDDAFLLLCQLVDELREAGHTIEHVDLGGGLGVPYKKGDPSSEQLLAEYADIVHKYTEQLACEIIFEPGRFIAANSGILVTQVSYVKQVEKKCFLIVDAGMNDLIRPTLYDAWHDVSPVAEPTPDTQYMIADVVGPVCETGDYLALDRKMPVMCEEDLLVLHSAGAYGAAMANDYNTRPLIPEILVDGSRSHVIKARPSYQEIIDQDSIPDWI